MLLAALALMPISAIAQAADVPGLAAEMSVMEDPSGAFSLPDVLAQRHKFAPIRGFHVNPGYTSSTVWVRVAVGTGTSQTVLLALSPNFVDFVDVFVPTDRDGSAYEAIALGDHRPLPNDDFSGIENVVVLDLEAGETSEVYIRLQSVNSALSLFAEFYSPGAHTMRNTLASLGFGVWFGGMAILIVVQLVFFSFDRRAIYLLVAASTFGAVLVYGGTAGLSRVLLFPQGGIGNDLFTALSVWFGQIATSLAAASVLDLRAKSRSAYWATQFSVLVGLAGTVATFAGYHRSVAPLGSLAMIAVASIVLFESVRLARREGLEAKLNAIAFLVLWLGLMLTLAQRAGLTDMPDWVGHAYAVSNLVYVLLLTGAMAVRLRAAESLNRAMREEALVAAEAARQQANAMVVERTRELDEAKRVAEDALNAELASQQQQVRFMEVISHQYRTPLAGLRSNVDSIGLSLPASDTANHQRLARVRGSIVRLVEVLEVNLARARLQGSAFRPELTPVPVAEAIRAAAARGKDLMQHDIDVDIGPGMEGVRALIDADMIGIALINLIENAMKFSASRAKPAVTLSCALVDGEVVICVSDEGIGIPQDEIAGVAALSTRGSNARHIPGSGTGLSLVSRIVSAHGGSLGLDSRLGEGTTVRIGLPVLAR